MAQEIHSAAIDRNGLAGDKPGIVGYEEGNHAGDFVHGADTPQRRVADLLFAHVGLHGFNACCASNTGQSAAARAPSAQARQPI